jgi:hypothetical protein
VLPGVRRGDREQRQVPETLGRILRGERGVLECFRIPEQLTGVDQIHSALLLVARGGILASGWHVRGASGIVDRIRMESWRTQYQALVPRYLSFSFLFSW